MKNLKLLYLLAVTLFASGCSSVWKLAVPTGMDNGVSISPKNGKFTKEELLSWGHADLAKDTIPGMSVEKAHAFLKGKKATPVIVAIADTGIDTGHEDLKDVLWKNKKEIAGNGKDDDKNGFVDDIHGWNFLSNTYDETLEVTRIYRKLSQKYSGKMATDVAAADKREFAFFKKVEKEIAPQLANAGSNTYYDVKHDPRKAIGDDPYDYSIKIYGDGNVKHSVEGESHGSHVAGIVAATRNNGKGINGVANNVKIMSVRVVPHGDEYDKEVALGIRYAVDNGAKVINTSFGKGYSPNKEWVYDAIKYAAKKDVLIVNAAGNDGKDIDIHMAYPNDAPDLKNEISDNVLTVGAISPFYDDRIVASFSNYGKRNVDVFAPGVRIQSTIPESNYAAYSGTSMAAPSAAGVAALVRSYYPKLSASQVKHIIMNSGTKIDRKVLTPGKDAPSVPFGKLSVSGRIVNAYNAVKMAEALLGGKKR